MTATTTYSELAAHILDDSGIQYRPHQRNWIGKVLGVVAERNAIEGGPPLTALCVSSGDEKVGAGYAYVLKLMGQPKPKDLQPRAAESRLECYRFHGADLPPGGGVPTPTARSRRNAQGLSRRRGSRSLSASISVRSHRF